MGRHQIEGRWYDVADYKTARAEHQQWKSGNGEAGKPVPEIVPKFVAKPQPVAQPKPVVLPRLSVGSKVAVTLPVVAVQPKVDQVLLQGIGSGLELYRGDSREPDVIARDGFQIWGDAVAAVSAAGGMAEFILHKLYNAYSNERDIERYIVTAKDRARPTISTSRNEGCGGYDSGNIYRIEYMQNELQEYPFDDVIKAYLPTVTGSKFPNFKLYMDRPDIKLAKQIALDLNIATQEVVYFRHVPGSKITQYKPKDGKAFQPMPTAAAKPKLW